MSRDRAGASQPVSDTLHQFPPEIVRRAVWLRLRFTLSDRDVEELPAERGSGVASEGVRRGAARDLLPTTLASMTSDGEAELARALIPG